MICAILLTVVTSVETVAIAAYACWWIAVLAGLVFAAWRSWVARQPAERSRGEWLIAVLVALITMDGDD